VTRLDPSTDKQLLSFGAPEGVQQAVRKIINETAPCGSCIMSLSESLHYGCQLENIPAKLSAAKRYGRYPNLTKIVE
jgi:hypothetical protein